jgi:hypothetical protein
MLALFVDPSWMISTATPAGPRPQPSPSADGVIAGGASTSAQLVAGFAAFAAAMPVKAKPRV